MTFSLNGLDLEMESQDAKSERDKKFHEKFGKVLVKFQISSHNFKKSSKSKVIEYKSKFTPKSIVNCLFVAVDSDLFNSTKQFTL